MKEKAVQPEPGKALNEKQLNDVLQRMPESTQKKYRQLEMRLRSLGRVVVAFSGGVDSSFLAAVAHLVLGTQALMVTAFSETYAPWERERALRVAETYGFRHWVLERSELDIPEFVSNPADRCYHCKLDLFKKLRQRAIAESIPYLLEGTTADDVEDYRPGRRAVAESNALSPLLEADLYKAEIREFSEALGLETWDRPSSPCLASRIPYGETVTREKLKQVERGERYLHELGLSQCRVRHHGDVARLEVPEPDIPKLVEPKQREAIVKAFKEFGFHFVTIDLAGFRSGSLNVVLDKDTKPKT